VPACLTRPHHGAAAVQLGLRGSVIERGRHIADLTPSARADENVVLLAGHIEEMLSDQDKRQSTPPLSAPIRQHEPAVTWSANG